MDPGSSAAPPVACDDASEDEWILALIRPSRPAPDKPEWWSELFANLDTSASARGTGVVERSQPVLVVPQIPPSEPLLECLDSLVWPSDRQAATSELLPAHSGSSSSSRRPIALSARCNVPPKLVVVGACERRRSRSPIVDVVTFKTARDLTNAYPDCETLPIPQQDSIVTSFLRLHAGTVLSRSD